MSSDKPPNIISSLVRLWYHFSKKRRRQFVILLFLMLFSSLLEMISLGAVLPFLGVLVDPERVYSHPVVAKMAGIFGITYAEQLILPFTLLFIVAAFVAGGVRLALLWVNARLSLASGADISSDVYKRTLYQSYLTHISQNSSDMISGIVNKVGSTVSVLVSLLFLISQLVLMVTIVITLFVIDARVASVGFISFGTCYVLVALVSRRKLYNNSLRIAHEYTQVVKALQEGLGGIRDVLLDGKQLFYCEIYRKAYLPLSRATASNTFINGAPRCIIESLVLAMVAGLSYGLSRQSEGLVSYMPVLGALAMGAGRLLPAMQQIYSYWASILGSHGSLLQVLDLLDQPLPDRSLQEEPEPLHFQKSIVFDSVRFKYNNDGPWVLNGVNLSITKGGRIGIVGCTGSGKSTMIDLLMGLLEPTEGQICVDGKDIMGANKRSWQCAIAHVPQNIYLADTSMAENIAFGVSPEDIDMARVQKAARQAQLDEFIQGMPDTYNTRVGERGVRLSGGQCQRIGIARALYRRASVLVFDEATSALDNKTEKMVMQSIEELNRDLTIIIIAHRLTTVKHCDQIVELVNGQVAAQGSYGQLFESSPSFRGIEGAIVT